MCEQVQVCTSVCKCVGGHNEYVCESLNENVLCKQGQVWYIKIYLRYFRNLKKKTDNHPVYFVLGFSQSLIKTISIKLFSFNVLSLRKEIISFKLISIKRK